ncbi:unnamed protein product [Boreogadus saida]
MWSSQQNHPVRTRRSGERTSARERRVAVLRVRRSSRGPAEHHFSWRSALLVYDYYMRSARGHFTRSRVPAARDTPISHATSAPTCISGAARSGWTRRTCYTPFAMRKPSYT